MPTSLLSLPDELLDLVVDQALGEYAPRLYKERQETACALALVNTRVGAIAKAKLVEAVHISSHDIRVNVESHPAMRAALGSRHAVRALSLDPGRNFLPHGFPARFGAVRHLVVKNAATLYVRGLNELKELQDLDLTRVEILADAPLTCKRLFRLSLVGCRWAQSRGEPAAVVSAQGCPSLRHLCILNAKAILSTVPNLLGQDNFDHVDSLRFILLDEVLGIIPWTKLGAKPAIMDKALFHCSDDSWAVGLVRCPGVRHLNVSYDYAHSSTFSDPAQAAILGFRRRADDLADLLPDLVTIYLPVEFAPPPMTQPSLLGTAFDTFALQCEAHRVEIVWVSSARSLAQGTAAAHFEARCQRVKAEQAAAAASAAVQTATTSAAAAARR